MAELEDRFAADGFVVLRKAVPLPLIVDLQQTVEAAYGLALKTGQELTDTCLWARIPVTERIGRQPLLIATARRLLACKQLRLWQDQLIVKRAESGSATEMHRDAPYWPMETASAVTCWLPLRDVDEASGAMFFVPGSQREAERPTMLPGTLAALVEAPACEVDRKQKMLSPVAVPLTAGDCTFHSGLVAHGAFANRSSAPRLAYKLVYFVDGTRFRFQWHSATIGMGLADGDPIAGDSFPVLP